ncbi:MAG: RNA methyltransferase [Oscillospiraceae bacterium]|jgi:TrmH family RNA methyltransferase|nr:RNA methyltransferase [Oscillospiraceae bacterium]
MLITSRQNPLVKHIRRLGADAAYRREQGLYLADGRKLLDDALRSGVRIAQAVFTEGISPPALSDTEVITVPKELMGAISPLETPQGVLFVCPIPAPPPAPRSGRWLLLDRVQDPGNVGSILRTAEAFGLDGVLLFPGCADPFSPKAVRASMGAVFRLPVGNAESTLPLMVADIDGPAVSVFPKDCVVALGNEGQGVSPELKSRADAIISIPMPGRAESLGVAAAAAILCWEMSKCRH